MNYFDVQVFYWLNHFADTWPVFDRLMTLLAQDGVFVYAILLVTAWFGLPREAGTQRHALVMAVAAAALALGINYLCGLLWFRPRPLVVLPGQPSPNSSRTPPTHLFAATTPPAAWPWRRVPGAAPHAGSG